MQDQELRAAGLKVTLPRLKVLKILEQANPRHLTAEDVYKKLLEQGEEIGPATVYRVLTQFEEAGLVDRLNFDGNRAVYELSTGEHHDHLVCLSCGTVSEFYDDLIETRQQHVAEQHGFLLKEHDHIIYGLCQNCQS